MPRPLISVTPRKSATRRYREGVAPAKVLRVPLTDNIHKVLPVLVQVTLRHNVWLARPLVLDHHPLRHLTHNLESGNEIFLRVSGAEAEANPTLDEGSRGKPNNNDGKLALEALPRKGGNLGRVVEHHGNNGGVHVTKHLASHPLQANPKHVGVAAKLLNLVPPLGGPVGPHDHSEGEGSLLGASRSHAARMRRPRAHPAQQLNQLP
mmetsp:Transcript_30937/g.72329  ORF Transcript_30937/g.72329 Transcript_30937/m.72329 type:complete len:207 (-) Transcript_30937:1320-1940(-)